jgi:hypothetical protein
MDRLISLSMNKDILPEVRLSTIKVKKNEVN